MNKYFSDRISDVPRSFIREILNVAISKEVISFAGGLPNRDLFPISELNQAACKVFEIYGSDALQYSNSEGYIELRKFISEWYKIKKRLTISINNILITNGSQQGLDLLGKIFLNEKDDVIIEEPGYLGAIQAFSVYRAKFHSVKLNKDGLDLEELFYALKYSDPKLMYSVPNFQNPSGISYSEENRNAVTEMLKNKEIYIVEDDPYGELNYSGRKNTSFKTMLPDQTILLGTFSKTVVPAFRIGWIVAPDEIMDKLIIAKQASDLHTNSFTQMMLYQYLQNNEIEQHISKIKNLYGKQLHAMISSIKKYFPREVDFTQPEGGMFMWVALPENLSAMQLFNIAIKQNVAFVPGDPFYINKENLNTLRLNFSCVDEKTIEIGIKRLSEAIKKIL